MVLSNHISVLLDEVCDALAVNRGGYYLDCTLGGAGHTQAILDGNEKSVVVGIDRDMRAIERSTSIKETYKDRFLPMHGKFSDIPDLVGEQKFDGILADLGISSDQLAEGRGFSFHDESDLDMRMDESSSLTADEIVNTYSHSELARVLKQGGVGNEARKIASVIIKNRPVENTKQLSELISQSVSYKEHQKKRHPATLTFQALRIAVNEEMGEIKSLLTMVPTLVKPSAVVAIISFHSSEDKLVASTMREWSGANAPPAMWGEKPAQLGSLLTRKAIIPSSEEVDSNPRSRSAMLRVFRFNGEGL